MEEQTEVTVELTEDRPSGWLFLPSTDGRTIVIRVADVRFAREADDTTTVVLHDGSHLRIDLSIVDFYGHLVREAP